MYQKPKLEVFGSFRELTQIGFTGASDAYLILGPDGSTSNGCELRGCATSS